MAGSTAMPFSASSFNSYENFRDHLVPGVGNATRPLHLVYQGVGQTWANNICNLIESHAETRAVRKNYNSVTRDFWLKVMPTEILDSHQDWHQQSLGRWISSGQLTPAEARNLKTRVGTSINFVGGPYGGSRKEPDLLVRSDAIQMPSIVMESGWSESITELQNDINLWLVGGGGDVRLVFILEWRLHNDNRHVSGTVEVYGLDSNGMPVRRGPAQTIFPKPANGQNQVITVTRHQLFSGAVAEVEPSLTTPPIAPGPIPETHDPERAALNSSIQERLNGQQVDQSTRSNSNDNFEYALDVLRQNAITALGFMGLVPASSLSASAV